ncbi:hypothetical protein ACOSQ4_023472 [Xanthoceras sorbifolium]
MMKLTYVFFAAHFLLGRERHRTVPSWLWGLVEDLVAFENFPWGTYVYNSTIYWLGKVLRSRLGSRSNKQNMKEKTPAKKQNLGINIYGFPWSLMIWALEAIPSLNGKCGIRQGDGIPRVCRWYCRKKPTGLVNEFKDDLEVLTTLTALEDEMKQDYYVSFDPDQLVGPVLHKIDGFGNDSEDDDMEKDVPVEDNAEKDVSVEDNEEKDVPAEDDVDLADNVCNEYEDIEIHEERQHRESKLKIQHDHLDVPRRRMEPVMVADHPTPPTVKHKKHKKQEDLMSFISTKFDELREEIRCSEHRTRHLIYDLRDDIHAVLPGVQAAPGSAEDNVEDYGEDTWSDINYKHFEDFMHDAEKKADGVGEIYDTTVESIVQPDDQLREDMYPIPNIQVDNDTLSVEAIEKHQFTHKRLGDERRIRRPSAACRTPYILLWRGKKGNVTRRKNQIDNNSENCQASEMEFNKYMVEESTVYRTCGWTEHFTPHDLHHILDPSKGIEGMMNHGSWNWYRKTVMQGTVLFGHLAATLKREFLSTGRDMDMMLIRLSARIYGQRM